MTDYSNWSLWDWEKEFVRAIASMEQNGVAVDLPLAQRENEIGQDRMAQIVEDLGGFKPSRSSDLEELLIRRLQLPVVRKTPKGKPSFDKKAMEEYELILATRDDPTARMVLEYRGWQKSCSTYFKAFMEKVSEDGRLRPHFKLHGARTGRMSCENPNLQQIPRETDEEKRWNKYTKKCITAGPGYKLWEMDYSNLELRLAAAYSGQQSLIEAFNSGESIWEYMSELLGGWDKPLTKTTTYAILYGAGLERLKNTLGVSLEEAQAIRKQYFATFPKFKWAAETINDGACRQGYVKYWTGRQRHFEIGQPTHKAFNSVLQGGGAECTKRSIVRIFREVCEEPYCKLALTVHDSIELEIMEGYEDEYLPRAQQIMEEIPSNFFGMKFTVGVNEWGKE